MTCREKDPKPRILGSIVFSALGILLAALTLINPAFAQPGCSEGTQDSNSGSFLIDHLNVPIDRYGHCEFTPEEAIAGFALMLVYAGDLELLSGVGAVLQGDSLKNFESIAEEQGIPYQVEGEKLEAVVR